MADRAVKPFLEFLLLLVLLVYERVLLSWLKSLAHLGLRSRLKHSVLCTCKSSAEISNHKLSISYNQILTVLEPDSTMVMRMAGTLSAVSAHALHVRLDTLALVLISRDK